MNEKSGMKSNRDLLKEMFPEQQLKFVDPEFDDAIIGVFKKPFRVTYSFSKCIDLLIVRTDIPTRGYAVDYINGKYCNKFEEVGGNDYPIFVDYEIVRGTTYFVPLKTELKDISY